eukprot:4139457-Prymnesium_polylepis.1
MKWHCGVACAAWRVSTRATSPGQCICSWCPTGHGAAGGVPSSHHVPIAQRVFRVVGHPPSSLFRKTAVLAR